MPLRSSSCYTDRLPCIRPPKRVHVLEAPCIPGASLLLTWPHGSWTQPLPFASTPGFWLGFGGWSSMTPSVLAERSHARGEEGRAHRPSVPLESPAGPRNSTHSHLPCCGPRAGPASQCLFLALCCNVYPLLHACPPARLGTATFCCSRGCCLAWADPGRRLALCRQC